VASNADCLNPATATQCITKDAVERNLPVQLAGCPRVMGKQAVVQSSKP